MSLNDTFNDADRVRAVCNSKSSLYADEVAVTSEVSPADRVKGTEYQLGFHAISNEFCYPLFHLPRAFDGEGEA